jgi:toxin ParE1/3/4
LAEIWAFIAEGSPRTATAFIHRIGEKFEPLRDHPELGPQRDQLAPGLRAHFYRDYVIYYSFTNTEVIVIRVVHGSRDAAALLATEE